MRLNCDQNETEEIIDRLDKLIICAETAKLKRIKMSNAIKVILYTPHIKNYLELNDPKALEQLRDSIS
jgi:hypothetical protein